MFIRDSAYIVLAGAVKVQVHHPDGTAVILAMLRAGELAGEMSLIDRFGRSAAVVAMEQLRFANQDLQGAYGHYDVYARYHVAARGKFPQVQSLIREANASCD